jgi:hypothetical protein
MVIFWILRFLLEEEEEEEEEEDDDGLGRGKKKGVKLVLDA